MSVSIIGNYGLFLYITKKSLTIEFHHNINFLSILGGILSIQRRKPVISEMELKFLNKPLF